MSRKQDLAWEALVRVTFANPDAERGKLNAALKAIRAAWHREGGLEEDLPKEIELRAQAYRSTWPGLTLTPTSLSVHWHRIVGERQIRTPQQQALDELRKEGAP